MGFFASTGIAPQPMKQLSKHSNASCTAFMTESFLPPFLFLVFGRFSLGVSFTALTCSWSESWFRNWNANSSGLMLLTTFTFEHLLQ